MSGRALFGHTGFVGSNLARQASFDHCFNRANIAASAGSRFELVVCCAAPAAKWLANREPEADAANLRDLMTSLAAIEADRFVLVSTVDVYPVPACVDETTDIEAGGHPYGRNRLQLERFIGDRFSDATVVRLPALFGPGLKKNLLYDLLAERPLSFTHPSSTFQFWNVERLWDVVGTALGLGVRLLNVTAEPVRAARVAGEVFGRDLGQPPAGTEKQEYDVRSIHAHHWGSDDGYLYHADQVLDELRAFVAAQREAR